MVTRTNWHSKALDLKGASRYNLTHIGLAGGKEYEIIQAGSIFTKW